MTWWQEHLLEFCKYSPWPRHFLHLKELKTKFAFSIIQLELQKNVPNFKDTDCSHPLPLTREKCIAARPFHQKFLPLSVRAEVSALLQHLLAMKWQFGIWIWNTLVFLKDCSSVEGSGLLHQLPKCIWGQLSVSSDSSCKALSVYTWNNKTVHLITVTH